MRASAIISSILCLTLICQFLSGCGGGGGGSDITDFSGVWSGNASLVEDSCGVINENSQFIFFNHLVSQNGGVIALDNGFLAFTGAVQSESSFVVSTERARAPLPGKDACTEKITFRYDAVTLDQAQFVVRTSDIRCTTGSETSECKFAFTGTAFRSSPPRPDPRPFPVEGDGSVGADVGTDNRGEAPAGPDSGAVDESNL